MMARRQGLAMRLATIAVLALAAAGLPGAAMAAQPPGEIEDFVTVCPAALMAPETLADALAARGLTDNAGLPLARLVMHNYATTDGSRTVSVFEQTFADAERAYCIVGLANAPDPLDLDGVRRLLEANALLGPLDGYVLPIGPGLVSGYLKRAGNDPLVAVSLNATRNVVTLTMERWSFAAREASP